MSRLLTIVAIYVFMFLAWISAGAFLTGTPFRAGNLTHSSFGLFPEVRRGDRGKKIVPRLEGLALLGFATHGALQVAELARGSL